MHQRPRVSNPSHDQQQQLLGGTAGNGRGCEQDYEHEHQQQQHQRWDDGTLQGDRYADDRVGGSWADKHQSYRQRQEQEGVKESDLRYSHHRGIKIGSSRDQDTHRDTGDAVDGVGVGSDSHAGAAVKEASSPLPDPSRPASRYDMNSGGGGKGGFVTGRSARNHAAGGRGVGVGGSYAYKRGRFSGAAGGSYKPRSQQQQQPRSL